MTIKESIWYSPRRIAYEINLIKRIEYLMDKLKEEEKPIIFKTIKFYIETSFNSNTTKVFRSNVYKSNNENYCQFTKEDFEDDYTKSLVIGGEYDFIIKIDDDTTFEQFDEQVYSFYRSIPREECTRKCRIRFNCIYDKAENENLEALKEIKNRLEKIIGFKIKQMSYKFPKKCGSFDVIPYLWDIANIHNKNHRCDFSIYFTPSIADLRSTGLSVISNYSTTYNSNYSTTYNLVFQTTVLDSERLNCQIDIKHLYGQIEEFFKTIPDLPN